MNHPPVRYAKSGDVNIAYSVAGEGPFDLVFVSGWVPSNLDTAWERPRGELNRRLAAFSRLIVFDKRGTGLSDRVSGIADLETRMDDVRAVMDAAGSRRAAVMGVSEGGPMAMLFAATYPERTAATVLYGTAASFRPTADQPWKTYTREQQLESIARMERLWGTAEYVEEELRQVAPSIAGDAQMRERFAQALRMGASPGAAAALSRMNMDIDVRHVLPAIRVPTLILHRTGDGKFDVQEAHYMARRIPGAEYVELSGRDHVAFVNPEQVCGEVERFLTHLWSRGEWDVVESERVLATVLFTDIVGATERNAAMGDRAWRDLITRHHATIRRYLARYQGREHDTAGDSFFASFDGPARAIRCAVAISDAVRELGLEVRSGLHTGECELLEGKVGGLAVHIGARVAAEAQPGEVLVSQTVRDLVAGSGIQFQEREVRSLKGVPGEWRLYSVERPTVAQAH